jgi:hypothetical protein
MKKMNNSCDYPTMKELYAVKEKIFNAQFGMTIAERINDTTRRGEEAAIRLGLDGKKSQ